MNRGFYPSWPAVLSRRLADNALLISAIALAAVEIDAPGVDEPMLKLFLRRVLLALAAFVAAFADSFPRGGSCSHEPDQIAAAS